MSPPLSASPPVKGIARTWWTTRAYLQRFSTYARMCGVDPRTANAYWSEISRDKWLIEELEGRLRETGHRIDKGSLGGQVASQTWKERLVVGSGLALCNLELYTIVRCLRPTVVLETGVASGISSTVILLALSRNELGQLYSVDLPSVEPGGYLYPDGTLDGVSTPAELGTGWIVPSRLRGRWKLQIGRGVDLIPRIASRVDDIGLFFHDSEHSYENMMSEFLLAWPYIRGGGCIYADDATWNSAFLRFASITVDVQGSAITPALRGIARKRAAGLGPDSVGRL